MTTTQTLFSGQITITTAASGDTTSIGAAGVGLPANIGTMLPNGLIPTSDFTYLEVFCSLTTLSGGTAPTAQIKVRTVGDDGNQYDLNSGAPTWSGAGNTYHSSCGPGCTFTNLPGKYVAIFWNLGGTAPPTDVVFTIMILGKH